MITETMKTDPVEADGETTEWAFTFKVYPEEGVKLIYTLNNVDTEITEDDNLFTVVYTDDGDSGGTVTYPLDSVLSEGYVTILRDSKFVQKVDFIGGKGFDPEVVERCVDRVTVMGQVLNEDVRRGIVSSVQGDPLSVEYIEGLKEESDSIEAQANASYTEQTDNATSVNDSISTLQSSISTNGGSANSLSSSISSGSTDFIKNGLLAFETEDIEESQTVGDYGKEYIIGSAVAEAVTITLETLESGDDGIIYHFRKENTGYTGIIRPPAGVKISESATGEGVEWSDTGFITIRYSHARLTFDVVSSSHTGIIENTTTVI